LRGLWPRDDLAQKLGQELGRREVLLRRLPGQKASGCSFSPTQNEIKTYKSALIRDSLKSESCKT
jgi:hypothetical protein